MYAIVSTVETDQQLTQAFRSKKGKDIPMTADINTYVNLKQKFVKNSYFDWFYVSMNLYSILNYRNKN